MFTHTLAAWLKAFLLFAPISCEMPGIKHVDIADDVALSAFRDTVAVAWFAPGKQPFDYSVSSFKRVGKWAEIHKYRLTLAALLRASHGHLLRQKKLSSQLLVF